MVKRELIMIDVKDPSRFEGPYGILPQIRNLFDALGEIAACAGTDKLDTLEFRLPDRTLEIRQGGMDNGIDLGKTRFNFGDCYVETLISFLPRMAKTCVNLERDVEERPIRV